MARGDSLPSQVDARTVLREWGDSLIVIRAGGHVPAHLAALFDSVEKLALVDLSRGPETERRRHPEDNRRFELYRGRRLSRWP